MRRGESDTQVRAIAIAALAGTFSGVIDFGVTTLTSVAPPPDVATSALIFVVEPEVARRD